MQGMRFLMLNEQGQPINHGIIAQTITAERYLCRFSANPPMSRVVRLDEIETWQLFPTDDELNKFIKAIVAQKPPVEPAAPPAPKPSKKVSKKKASKKVSKKKANGNGEE